MKKELIISRLKANHHHHRVAEAQKLYFMAMAINETNERIGQESKKAVLRANVFNITKENHRLNGEELHELRILTPDRDYQMSNTDFIKYCKLVHKERTKRGLIINGFVDSLGVTIPAYNTTSDYKSRPLLREAENNLIDITISVLPEAMRKELGKAKEHWKFREQLIKLSASVGGC